MNRTCSQRDGEEQRQELGGASSQLRALSSQPAQLCFPWAQALLLRGEGVRHAGAPAGTPRGSCVCVCPSRGSQGVSVRLRAAPQQGLGLDQRLCPALLLPGYARAHTHRHTHTHTLLGLCVHTHTHTLFAQTIQAE